MTCENCNAQPSNLKWQGKAGGMADLLGSLGAIYSFTTMVTLAASLFTATQGYKSIVKAKNSHK